MPSAPGGDAVIIKKYANRRLYNTETSSYITLDHLAEMVRAKRDFRVVDAKTGEDLTRSVLAQIIMEQEASGQSMLPVNFLRQLIGMYGNGMQSMVPQFLEESLSAFQRNQSQLREAMTGAIVANPFAEIARRNMEMFMGAAAAKKEEGEEKPSASELAELKAQLAALQERLNKIGS